MLQRTRKVRSRATAPRRARKRTSRRSAAPAADDSSPGSAPPETAGSSAPPGQELLFADPLVTPRGDGTFIVAPGKPRVLVPEVGTCRAAEMLGIGFTALRALRESKLGRHYLRWRFTSEKQKVLAWEVPSLVAYIDATRQLGK